MCTGKAVGYKVTMKSTLSGSPADYAQYAVALATAVALDQNVDLDMVTVEYMTGSTIMVITVTFINQQSATASAAALNSLTTATALAAWPPIAGIAAINSAVVTGATVTMSLEVYQDSAGLTPGEIAGIVIGSLVLVCCIIVIIVMVMKSSKKSQVAVSGANA